MPVEQSALLFEAVLGRRVSPAALEWLAQGFALFDRNDGALSLERCLGLPSASKRRRERRDFYLRQAAAALPADMSVPARAHRLGAELDALMARPLAADPLPHATALERALHHAALAIEGGARPTDKRLQQLLAAKRKFLVLEVSAPGAEDPASSLHSQPATP